MELPACGAVGAGREHRVPGIPVGTAGLSARERGAEQSPGQRGHSLTFLWDRVFPRQLREIASHLVQLQEALNELSEEHNAALAQSQEKQGQLESELRAALQEKVRGSRAGGRVPACSSLLGLARALPALRGAGRASCPPMPAHGERLCDSRLPPGASPCSQRVPHGRAGCSPRSQEGSPGLAEIKLLESSVWIKAG